MKVAESIASSKRTKWEKEDWAAAMASHKSGQSFGQMGQAQVCEVGKILSGDLQIKNESIYKSSNWTVVQRHLLFFSTPELGNAICCLLSNWVNAINHDLKREVGIAELKMAVTSTWDLVLHAETKSNGLSLFKNLLKCVFRYFDNEGLSSNVIFEINGFVNLNAEGNCSPPLGKKDPLFSGTVDAQVDIKGRLKEFRNVAFGAMSKDNYEPRPIMGQWPNPVDHSPVGHRSNCITVAFLLLGEFHPAVVICPEAITWFGYTVGKHLHMGISVVLQLGLSGQPILGSDTGGVARTVTPRFFVRWMSEDSSLPFCRGHAEAGTNNHEPWSVGEEDNQLKEDRNHKLKELNDHLAQAQNPRKHQEDRHRKEGEYQVGGKTDKSEHFKIGPAGGSTLLAAPFPSVFGGWLTCKIFASNSLALETGYSMFALTFKVDWPNTQVSQMSMVSCITLDSTSRVTLANEGNVSTMIANLKLHAVALIVFSSIDGETCAEIENQYRWIAYMSVLIGGCLEGVFQPVAEKHILKICLAMRKTFDAITIVELVPAAALLVVKEKGEEVVEEKEIDSWLNWNFAQYVSDCHAAKTLAEFEERQEIISIGLGVDIWDPGGGYYTESILSSSFFKIWDPGGSLSNNNVLLSIASP